MTIVTPTINPDRTLTADELGFDIEVKPYSYAGHGVVEGRYSWAIVARTETCPRFRYGTIFGRTKSDVENRLDEALSAALDDILAQVI